MLGARARSPPCGAQYSNSSPSPSGVGEQRAGVRAEAGEQRQLLAAHEHVDGVDLDHADAVEHPAQVAAVDPAGRAPVGEALGGERHPAGLGGGELDGPAAIAIRRGRVGARRTRSTASRNAPGVVVGDVHRQGEVPAGREVEAGGEEVVEEQLAPARVGVGEVGRASAPGRRPGGR